MTETVTFIDSIWLSLALLVVRLAWWVFSRRKAGRLWRSVHRSHLLLNHVRWRRRVFRLQGSR